MKALFAKAFRARTKALLFSLLLTQTTACEFFGTASPSDALRINTEPPQSTVKGTLTERPLGTYATAPYGYLEYLPSTYDSNPQAEYPLLIMLHGSGERGDGVSNLALAGLNGPNAELKKNNAQYYNHIIITPQCASSWNADLLNDLVDHLISHYRVNQRRIYLTGLSLGGGGVYAYASKYAHRLAAIMPLCASSNCSASGATAMVQSGLKIWAHHAYNDTAQSISASWSCMSYLGGALGATNSAQATYDVASTVPYQTAHFDESQKLWVWEYNDKPRANVQLTVHETGNHSIWGVVYSNPAWISWLFSQVRP